MPKIEQAYLFVSDRDGQEWIHTYEDPEGKIVPMIASDDRKLAMLLPTAKLIVHFGTPLRLLRFGAREDLGEITGGLPGARG